MKIRFHDGKRRSGLSALLTVIGILTVGALAKTEAATQLFHLAPWPAWG
jgi:hypothetical protein